MKISAAFALFEDLFAAIRGGFFPTVQAIATSPLLLFRPVALSRLFMAKVWVTFGDGVDSNGRPVKELLITPNAYGVLLDIGAGHGHTIKYLDPNRVTKYIALEPNTHMHTRLRSAANAAGFNESDGTLLILGCGAEDTASIISSTTLHGIEQPVDTLISILVLCSIPSPESALAALVQDVLKPGGQFLFYEHVLSHKSDVAWWQRFWTPMWSFFLDGCKLDRPTHLWIERMQVSGSQESIWRECEIYGKDDEPEENLFWHRIGRLVKV